MREPIQRQIRRETECARACARKRETYPGQLEGNPQVVVLSVGYELLEASLDEKGRADVVGVHRIGTLFPKGHHGHTCSRVTYVGPLFVCVHNLQTGATGGKGGGEALSVRANFTVGGKGGSEDACKQTHTHHKGINSRCGAGVRKRIQSNVHFVVALVVVGEVLRLRD